MERVLRKIRGPRATTAIIIREKRGNNFQLKCLAAMSKVLQFNGLAGRISSMGKQRKISHPRGAFRAWYETWEWRLNAHAGCVDVSSSPRVAHAWHRLHPLGPMGVVSLRGNAAPRNFNLRRPRGPADSFADVTDIAETRATRFSRNRWRRFNHQRIISRDLFTGVAAQLRFLGVTLFPEEIE